MEICEDKSTMTNNQTSQVTFFEDQNMEQNNENNSKYIISSEDTP